MQASAGGWFSVVLTTHVCFTFPSASIAKRVVTRPLGKGFDTMTAS